MSLVVLALFPGNSSSQHITKGPQLWSNWQSLLYFKKTQGGNGPWGHIFSFLLTGFISK